MNIRMLSLMAGIFSILITIQFLIFDLNQIIFIGYEDKYGIYLDINSKAFFWIKIYRKTINSTLSCITIMVSILLLYCIHTKNYKGLLCYTVWIFVYELISFSLVLFVSGSIKEQFKELIYMQLFFQVSRMVLHFFCVPFIAKHTYTLYKDPKTSGKIYRHRHSSINSIDSWAHLRLRTIYHKFS
ncbi:putative transmembrane protein 217B [Talpa occidentalis]|uniref:putative transmembrane protein 217B n=1 Tax=Talpa occidentalis TaxID=50954 RepID=UPI00188DE85E|nr:putative transmembrane protein 217B [Talpa occidentalis]XP_054554729.1 putative transmembrane protein 217B [Talpa occidentalis]